MTSSLWPVSPYTSISYKSSGDASFLSTTRPPLDPPSPDSNPLRRHGRVNRATVAPSDSDGSK